MAGRTTRSSRRRLPLNSSVASTLDNEPVDGDEPGVATPSSPSDTSSVDIGEALERVAEERREARVEGDVEEDLSVGSLGDTKLNLCCTKEIKSHFKAVYKLKPPDHYRLTFAKLEDFMVMTKAEQQMAKQSWKELSAKEKKRIKSMMGPACLCCKPKERAPRKDKGKKRGASAATLKNARKSKRQLGEDPEEEEEEAEEEEEVAEAPPDPFAGAASYTSMGHTATDRQASIPKPRTVYKRQEMSTSQYAPTLQTQGGGPARKALQYAIEKTIAAATMSTKAPTLNKSTGKYGLDQRKKIPRVRVLLAILNDVVDTPGSGGTLGKDLDKLRRKLPELTLVSSSEEDYKKVFKALCATASDPEDLLFDYFRVFGTGEDAIERFHHTLVTRKIQRAKKAPSREDHQDTGAHVPTELAPTVDGDC